MITIDKVTALNEAFRSVTKYADEFLKNIGNKVNNISESKRQIITQRIPEILRLVFDSNQYTIKGSVGAGRQTSTPWVAIMDKDITTSTQRGVYIVFLFRSDMKGVYISIGQGTTVEGSFGFRTSTKNIAQRTRDIRELLMLNSPYLETDNESVQVSDEKYKTSLIYSKLWDLDVTADKDDILTTYVMAYSTYKAKIKSSGKDPVKQPQVEDVVPEVDENPVDKEEKKSKMPFSIKTIIEAVDSTGLLYTPTLIKRFAFSLMTKPFVILSGLAGSGKTQLALAFAKALTQDESQYRIVSVGADWTNREPLLGFPNALNKEVYEAPENRVLQLLIDANKPENAEKPYFLILDEMNMSYVERYFADFLSVMESHDKIALWKRQGTTKDPTPESVTLPKNLFIIGTINVDETTYMFSPKVLDRANVIEFKIAEDEMMNFLMNMSDVNVEGIASKCSDMGKSFVELAAKKTLDDDDDAKETLYQFFTELKKVNAEFGYRSATEIFRFISQAKNNDDTDKPLSNEQILDATIVQKLLPKLHGSRKKLEPVLKKLWALCMPEGSKDLIELDNLKKAVYPESADKIVRMYNSAMDNGFTSFAEA